MGEDQNKKPRKRTPREYVVLRRRDEKDMPDYEIAWRGYPNARAALAALRERGEPERAYQVACLVGDPVQVVVSEARTFHRLG